MEMPPIFYEVHSNIPREGPGSNESTKRAFNLLKGLPPKPHILDVGCGPGMQTVELAKLSGGHIEAVDNHQPFLDQLIESAKKAEVSSQINAVKGDMFNLKYPKESFNVVWCEGAIFIIGFEKGLREWKQLLKSGGYMVVSELSFFSKDLPTELNAYMKEMYAGLEGSEAKTSEDNLQAAKKLGFSVVDSFALPESDWWDNYYTLIGAKLPLLKAKYQKDPEAMQYLAGEEREIEMFRNYSNFYGYQFYILKKT